jgi:hypothetical protein
LRTYIRLKQEFTFRGEACIINSRCPPILYSGNSFGLFAKEAFNWCQMWWHTYVIPSLGRQRQEGIEFKASLGYIARLP